MAFCIVDHAALSRHILIEAKTNQSDKSLECYVEYRPETGGVRRPRSKNAMLSKCVWRGVVEECQWIVLVVMELLMEVLLALMWKLVEIAMVK